MGLETSFTPRFRQRKISLKQNSRILWEKKLPEAVEDVRGDLLGIVETGVDKSEEDERHLQAVLHSATLAGKAADAFIPTPKATKKIADYAKYYKSGWVQTESYIRSSATVEDAQGVEYCLDSEDLTFLQSVINKGISDVKAQCSEDEFESICTLIENVVAEKQPFLSTDVTQLMQYKEAEPHIFAKLEERRRNASNPLDPERLMLEANSPDYAPRLTPSPYRDLLLSVKLFGALIYSHWRDRKLVLKGRSIKPCVLFESGLASDDQNPYVTFRHREVRHTRKTRRTDQQNSGRSRKLHGEMHDAQSIFELILKRERSRLQQIQTDFEVFESRCRVKALKRKSHIDKEADDIELLVSVSKRARQEEAARQQREEADRKRRAQLAAEKSEREREKREKREELNREAKAAAADATAAAAASESKKAAANTVSGSRIPALEHVTVEQQALERSMEIDELVAIRMQQRKNQDSGWIDLSDSATIPFFDFLSDLSGHSDSASQNMHTKPYVSLEYYNENEKEECQVRNNSKDLFYSSIELRTPQDLDRFSRSDADRLPLPNDTWIDAENTDLHESPEVIHVDGDGSNSNPFTTQFYSEIDFRRQPSRFSAPQNKPSARSRKRKVGALTYIDRILPAAYNPMSKFAKELRETPRSDADERLVDRFKFDQDIDSAPSIDELLNDPAKLNNISPQTQNLRFSSMLTGKASDILSDAQAQRRKAVQAMLQRMQQQQKQQRALADAQALRNAQMQASNNTARVQQAQKAAQRQLQRNKKMEENKEVGSRQPGNATLDKTKMNKTSTNLTPTGKNKPPNGQSSSTFTTANENSTGVRVNPSLTEARNGKADSTLKNLPEKRNSTTTESSNQSQHSSSQGDSRDRQEDGRMPPRKSSSAPNPIGVSAPNTGGKNTPPGDSNSSPSTAQSNNKLSSGMPKVEASV